MEVREVQREPVVPYLSEKVIRLLTELCFRRDDVLQSVDVIFVFSTFINPDIVGKKVRGWLDQGISKKVIVTGGFPLFTDISLFGKSESEMVLEHIGVERFSEVLFLLEKRSNNTLANVIEGLNLVRDEKIDSVLFLFKAFACGRGYLTLRKYLPQAILVQQSFSSQMSVEESEFFDQSNWFLSDLGRRRVWGEFLRIKLYGERGDIVYDEVRSVIQEIEATIAQ